MRLILIRHGQTPSNVGRHLDTAEPGPGLTALGLQQAEALPRALHGERVEAVYASTLLRTQLTAAPLARELGLDVPVRAGLREISAGDLEMANDELSIRRYLSTVLGWANGDVGTRLPGGEDGGSVLARFDAVVEEVAGSGAQTVALVSHGAMIRTWAGARCRNIGAGFVAENPVSNTGAVVLEGRPGRWTVERWQEQALGGALLADPYTDGAAGEPLEP
jgi:broad specificity phosphatase PhoE